MTGRHGEPAKGAPPEYVPRLLDQRIASILSELPAVLILGPRAVGKTTTAKRYAKTIVRLDRDAEANAFRDDPDVALAQCEEPVLLDEWQAVPGVLGAIKRSVDEDSRPGRFVITGSVTGELTAPTWPGTGRVIRTWLYGLGIRERRGRLSDPVLDGVLDRGLDAGLRPVTDPPDLRGYLELAFESGYPEPALRLSQSGREEWLASHIDQIVTRDAALAGQARDPSRLRRYFTAYANATARVVDEATLWRAADVDRRTAVAYEQLLTNLFIVERISAWTSNRLKRLARTPKRYVVDAAVAATQIGVDPNGVMNNPDLVGSLLDTFVASQLRAEIAGAGSRVRLHHLRVDSGRQEVDLVAESPDGKVIAFEVKAGAAVAKSDAKHLRWLRDQLGDDFAAGIVLYAGARSYRLDDRIVAAPIALLWS